MRPLARLVTAFAVAVTLSAEASHAAPATGSELPSPPDRAEVRLQERRSWAAQVRAMRAQERAELDSLARELSQRAPGADLARGQRELEEHKRMWRRTLLKAQLERAQAAGTPANAARLKSRLAELDARDAQRAAARSTGGTR
ncbi:MAG: hypothetical protein IPJ04_16160 [Candidatus Eisenbacteria bacterium]|nr:hypothetical protein [Candidatus Eisenbacteria bacterium]